MVIPAAPVFLDLETGKISGVRMPATRENALQLQPAGADQAGDPGARADDREGATAATTGHQPSRPTARRPPADGERTSTRASKNRNR